MNVADIRKDYTRAGLSESDVDPDPIRQFDLWFQQALASNLTDANAMTLATAGADGRPSARVVLLKDFDSRGFVFYTNYESRKGRELAENPYAALIFFWAELERQVRIEGTIERVSREESEAYFRSRPTASRLGAWASEQSRVIANREELEERLNQVAAKYGDQDIPLPPFWGGYRLLPDAIEFWQGRPSRLHDRLLYSRDSNRQWSMHRLSP
jgi:pyridoxamine 5'-phosphate oxidase